MNVVKESFLGFVRHALTTAGGAVIATGYVGEDEWQAIIGGIVALVGVAWSFIDKKRKAAQ